MNKPIHLLDVNVVLALLSENHIHHRLATEWFLGQSDLQWALCAFSEAGFLRIATAPRPGSIRLGEATAVLQQFATHPGYHFLPISEDWSTLTAPLAPRLYGTKQVTDAFLLGLAIRHNVVLVTMDRDILHLAGDEHLRNVFLLSANTTAQSPAP